MAPVQRLTRYLGNWDYRLEGIFSCGVAFAGKRILDAGCNVGVIGYEIGKHRPIHYHGIDMSSSAVNVSKAIFLGYEFPSEFNLIDMADTNALERLLKPEYDVVLFLAVWMHIRRAYGAAIADRVTRILASRCKNYLVVRAAGKDLPEMMATLSSAGFDQAQDGRLMVFYRRGVAFPTEKVIHPPPPLLIEDNVNGVVTRGIF